MREVIDPDAVPGPGLVSRLLREQAPELAALTPRSSQSSGSSNWVFRLGDKHAIRLPRADSYVGDLLKEAQWLPRLTPALSVPVPDVVFLGEPSTFFPRPWTVVSWVGGELPVELDAAQQVQLAETLGRFMRSLHSIETFGLTEGAEQWGYRAGEPVTDTIDAWADSAADDLSDLFDPGQVREAWRRLRNVPHQAQLSCWVHTDLSAENLLVGRAGDVVGVIDFGGLGIGDRSVDLLYAWDLLDAPARNVLRESAEVDDATWLRARAWAFVGPGLLTIADYRRSMPQRTARLTRMVEAVAVEVGVSIR